MEYFICNFIRDVKRDLIPVKIEAKELQQRVPNYSTLG